jgi:hypothetical protein
LDRAADNFLEAVSVGIVGVDGRIILNGFSRSKMGEAWTGSGCGQGQVVGTYKCSTEPPGSIKRVEFHD